MHVTTKLWNLVPALVFLSGLLLPTSTHAQDWHVVPVLLHPSDSQGNILPNQPYFQITAAAGTTVNLDAFVGNKGHSSAGIDLVPVDATTGVYGAISYNLPEQPRKHVGSWVHLSHKWVQLSANRGMVVPFSVQIPSKIAPGQYIGALTAYVPASVQTVTRGLGLREQFRVFNAIVVTVPGPMVGRLAVKAVTVAQHSNDDYLIVHIKNSGNILLKGQGHLWVYGSRSRRPWISVPLSIDTTVPGTSLHYPVPWTHRAPAGQYRFAAQVWWNGGSAATGDSSDEIRWAGGTSTMRGTLIVH